MRKISFNESFLFVKSIPSVLLSKNISDEEKEVYFKKNSILLMKVSLIYGFYFLLIFLLIETLKTFHLSTYSFLISWNGIFYSIFISILYYILLFKND